MLKLNTIRIIILQFYFFDIIYEVCANKMTILNTNLFKWVYNANEFTIFYIFLM